MFPDGGRTFATRTWQCPWCGTPYKDGEVCPHDDEHWTEFSDALRGADAPVPTGRRQGVA